MLTSRCSASFTRRVSVQRQPRVMLTPRAQFDLNEVSESAKNIATLTVSSAASLGAVGAAAYPIFDTFFSVRTLKKDMKTVKAEVKRIDRVVGQIAEKMGIPVAPMVCEDD